MNKVNINTAISSLKDYKTQPSYRPDIDGLRALAILSVVLFHAFPTFLQGGFVGVDVFFVISGFLISTIIFKNIQGNNFCFIKFYTHRIKRIFPALIIVLLVCYLFGWFTLLPEEFKQLGKHIAAGTSFIQNLVLWREAGYFDTASELKPLMHLWSLAIEEQFYIIYPLIIFLVWRFSSNTLIGFIIIGSILSFSLNIIGVGENTLKTFFIPQTRFWELLIGSLLAYFQVFNPLLPITNQVPQKILQLFSYQQPFGMHQKKILQNLLSLIGISLIVYATFSVNKSKLFPGWWALIPVMGAFLLILAGPGAVVNRKILSNQLIVFIGLISYPLYLWHWPILSYLRIVESEIPSVSTRIVAVILSFILAWLTYRLIEKPIRFGSQSSIKIIALILSSVLLGSIGFYTYVKSGFPARMNLAMSEEELLKERNRYWNESQQIGAPFSPTKTNIIVFGDSQAHDILHALRNEKRIGLKFFASSHECSAFFSANKGSETTEKDCNQFFNNLISSEEIKQADVLIYAHQWRPGMEVEKNYTLGVNELRKKNEKITIYFFGPKLYLSPYGSINTIVKSSHHLLGMNEFLLSKVVADNDNDYVEKLAKQNNVQFVDVRNIFCMEGCEFYKSKKYSYFDSNHWSQSGADLFFKKLSTTTIFDSIVSKNVLVE
ncbi:acyltransferase family protein [Legionella sp. D16C41]|uniref:acyltransferase family protein n=1 Tax=Legionella sp. D16C41 TaxID=3402688 RepID=UPI003AF9BE76